jgi:glyoxylase-like metal-dependent hydrolase (beta-lactamase superfamily II)
MSDALAPIVHRFEGSLFPVNAYLVEGPHGVVAVDATLGVTDGRALRARADALGKPLVGVVVTHAHPDHYGAISVLLDGLDVPVLATRGVADAIVRDDATKEAILRPMFGPEWPERRTFPTTIVADGERVELGGVRFRVIDLGPGESPHDSIWLLEDDAGARAAFTGDLAYGHMHGYLADGEHASWLANIGRAHRLLGEGLTMYPGHGEPGPVGPLLDWQEQYIRTFLAAVRSASAARPGDASPDDATITGRVTEEMKRFLPNEELLFLMQLSVPAIARGRVQL